MFGDVLKEKIKLISTADKSKVSPNSLWIIIRNIAREDIFRIYPNSVDSDIAVPIYYEILCNNIDLIPTYYKDTLHSNNQERFRVIVRNLFTSNAFHKEGLANQKGIIAYKEVNFNRKGYKIVYRREK